MLDSTVVVNVLHTIHCMKERVTQFELEEEEKLNTLKVIGSLRNDFDVATKRGDLVGFSTEGSSSMFIEPPTLEDSIFNYKARYTKAECAIYWRVLSTIRENLEVLHPTSASGLHGVEISPCERATENFDIFLEGIKPRLGLEA